MMTQTRLRLPSAVEWSHQCLGRFVRPGDTAVDATLGNGNDALFLAGKTGIKGHVYGYDTQANAVHSSRLRLEQSGVAPSQFTLFECSHH